MQPYPYLYRNLAEIDEDTFRLIEFEKRRQERKLIMIASESICPKAVLEAQASVFSNLYAEGYPSLAMSPKEGEQILDYEKNLLAYVTDGDRRYYKGCDYVNFVEALAQWRAAQLFAHKDEHVDIRPQDIYVNVQPLSGAAANNAVYTAFVEPGQTIMGMSLSHGGHLTHGSKVNRSGKLYQPVQYKVDAATGRLNYDAIRELARQNKPKMIIAGASAYPWDIDWRTLRSIADEVGAMLMADIAHPSGLVAAGLFPNPVGYAHATTMTTHKTLCGPRGAIILTTEKELATKIEKAVFPGEQGGPHINTIAGLAVAFKLAATPEFRDMMRRVVENAKALADGLEKRGLKLACGGTNTHLCLVDLKAVKTPTGVSLKGEVMANVLDLCGLTCNRNTIPGDTTSAEASGIRLGTTWLTQIGMGKEEMDRVAAIVHKVATNIHTYAVDSKTGTSTRGKLPFAVMQDVKGEVDKLLHQAEHPECPKYPHYYAPVAMPAAREHVAGHADAQATGKALAEGAAVAHHAEAGIIEVVGQKAVSFVSDVVSSHTVTLEIGQGTRAFVCLPQGNVIDDVHVWRMPDEEKSKLPRLWIVTTAQAREKVKDWLRALATGYVLCDEAIAASNASGPVYVRDLFEQKPSLTTLVLAGAKASQVIGNISGKLATMAAWNVEKVEYEHLHLWVARTGYCAGQTVYEIYLPAENVPALLKKLEGQSLLAGHKLVEILRGDVGLAAAHEWTAAAAYAKFPAYFAKGKPFFVGMQAVKEQLYAQGDKKSHVLQPYKGEPRYTCLGEEHKKLTKRALVPFAGWMMPILYTSILEEHKVVREKAALFDVTHMGVAEVSGKGAARFLDLLTPNDVEKLNIGQSQYSFLLTPEGDAIDDMTIYRRDKDKFMIVINASNAEKDLAWIREVASGKVLIDNEFPGREMDVHPLIRDLKAPEAGKDRKVDIALQGPTSLDIMKAAAGNDEKLKARLGTLGKWQFIEATIADMPMIICRSGYTGENWGFEVYLHPEDAPKFWNLLFDKGKPFGIQATGLGARDSTRTEAGFPLYGHELAGEYQITPLESGYPNFVRYDKPFFIGKKALMAKDRASTNRIVRFEMQETGIRAVRPGAVVTTPQGQVVGVVTSCAYVGAKQVGLAYVDKKFTVVGTRLGILNKSAAQPKPIGELKPGDSLPVTDAAVIVTRFAMRS